MARLIKENNYFDFNLDEVIGLDNFILIVGFIFKLKRKHF